ncbi:hypothetical protein [Anoxynatronum buryatiense]|uniref:hypothetical protein n=1 Tax=Anoxynatronum buryatiense TaxID=489973 RepID=UPI0024B7A500|nr:hypothetical protein [Anoxynatronum buryatiense]
MNKWFSRILAVLLIASLTGNVWFYMEYRQNRQRLNAMEALVSQSIERNIRQSMRQIDFLMENETPESLQRLQSAVEELTASFMQWALMNQREEVPHERLQEGLAAMEALRNMLVDQLERQYRAQESRLGDPDRAMLTKVHDQLGRLLLIYHNIQGRLDQLRNPDASDGGLRQLTEQIQETVVLYRHSALPNQHPGYLEPEEALLRAEKYLPLFSVETMELTSREVRIREGVHTYRAEAVTAAEPAKLRIDARDGRIREFQAGTVPEGPGTLAMEHALEVARSLMPCVAAEEVREEFMYNQNGQTQPVYLFRFTPVVDGEIIMTSDACQITISAVDGTVVHFASDFSETMVPEVVQQISMETLRNECQPELGRMIYEGQRVIRTFGTRFSPRLAYSYRVMRNGQSTLLYFDVETGRQIHEAFDLFQPVTIKAKITGVNP